MRAELLLLGILAGCGGRGDWDGDGLSPCKAAGDRGCDCDDADPRINWPSGPERCDGRDNDCDGEVDGPGSLDARTFHPDQDGDGWGDERAGGVRACEAPGPGQVEPSGDCDDSNPDVNPGATEGCDGEDEDCDGEIDQGISIDWFFDADGDGHGADPTRVRSCAGPPGEDWVEIGGDCDDTAPAARPGLRELCDDDLDNDCSGQADSEDPRCFGHLEIEARTIGLEGGPAGRWSEAGTSLGYLEMDGEMVLLVSAPAWNREAAEGLVADAGRVWALSPSALAAAGSGEERALLEEGPGIRQIGSQMAEPDALFGGSLAGGADLTGDGSADLVVAAPFATSSGHLHLFSNPFDEAEVPALLGLSAAFPHGDGGIIREYVLEALPGLGILAVGMPLAGGTDPLGGGQVLVLRAPISASAPIDEAAVLILDGPEDVGGLGTAMAAGDLDGDGLEELLIGQPAPVLPCAATGGLVAVLDGETLRSADGGTMALCEDGPSLLVLSDFGAGLGSSLSAGADLDGDGYGDVAAGAFNWGMLDDDLPEGAAFVLPGGVGVIRSRVELAETALRIEGDGGGVRLGISLASGDLDQDGAADLVLRHRRHAGLDCEAELRLDSPYAGDGLAVVLGPLSASTLPGGLLPVSQANATIELPPIDMGRADDLCSEGGGRDLAFHPDGGRLAIGLPQLVSPGVGRTGGVLLLDGSTLLESP